MAWKKIVSTSLGRYNVPGYNDRSIEFGMYLSNKGFRFELFTHSLEKDYSGPYEKMVDYLGLDLNNPSKYKIIATSTEEDGGRTQTKEEIVNNNKEAYIYFGYGHGSSAYYKIDVEVYEEILPPSTPSSINVPTEIKGGESITISWGSSSRATRYHLERSVNGGPWTQIYQGTSLNFTDSITKGWNTVAYRVRAYNSDGYSNYRTSATRTVINNTPPIISGQDQDLGDKNLGFLITYQIDDVDTADNLVVTEKLNGSIIRTINGAPRNENLEIEITNETLFSLPLNSENTIEIKVDDQNGGIAYRRYTFRRTNTAPIISDEDSDEDKDLGQKTEPFSIDFTVTDNEGNAITVKTYLDNVLKEEYQAEDGATNTFTISQEDWFKLPIGQHSIKIEAKDEHGATAVRNYTFTRFDDKIQFTLKTPIETDIMATKLLVTPTWHIPAGAIGKVEACNNGFDEVPTWEDITSQVLINRHYNFTNTAKTAEKWGINIRFTIEKGTAAEECVINGFGGAFE